MPLKSHEIKSLRPIEKSFKVADARGLYLLVKPNGSKRWYFKYRHGGKEKKMSIGEWPEVSLSDARNIRDAAKFKLSSGTDPMLERKREKVTAHINAANTFSLVATEYIDHKMVGEGRAASTILKARWFLEQLSGSVGSMPITDIDPQMMLAALKRLESKGVLETAKKCRSFASRVFRYGAATGRCSNDPTSLLQGALIAPKARSYAAILEPAKLSELLRTIDQFTGYPVIRAAMQILPHVYVRPGELRHAEWEEFDFAKEIWTIPEGKMKMRVEHSVPLSKQVISMLQELHAVTGQKGYVFPAIHTRQRPLSENTINASFRRMGFDKDEVTAHGFRSTASTLLNESGLWHPDAIERALGHRDKNKIRATYNRGTYWDERVRMAQWWSDYLDSLKAN